MDAAEHRLPTPSQLRDHPRRSLLARGNTQSVKGHPGDARRRVHGPLVPQRRTRTVDVVRDLVDAVTPTRSASADTSSATRARR